MKSRRKFTTFSLSFLDIMSCGFGAAVLLFLVIKHDVDARVEIESNPQTAEVALLEEDVRIGQQDLVRLRNTAAELDDRLVDAHGEAKRIVEALRNSRGEMARLAASSDGMQIERLQEELRQLEQERLQLESERDVTDTHVRRFVGEGDRQYLTGLKMGGKRILILLDQSASMLDHAIVNVIRRRNMSESAKRASRKWRRAVSTVDWLTAQLPPSSDYQIYTFNTEVTPAIPGSEGRWLEVGDRRQLEQAVQNLHNAVPDSGTSLEKTFLAIKRLSPLPDNIFLITDGLPTQGAQAPRRNTVTGRERLALFQRAIDILPAGVPLNIILAPMEGDPMAAAAYWELAQTTQGAFLSPSRDWP
ncbi:MAG: VWA domain-containing protein [Gammaproteobacteria bacterium]|nr:VWA domain-containing protein [Gammaproteobacteria bacterium]